MTRILVVEDEGKLARFLQLELEHEGYAVDTAADGVTGLSKALEGKCDLMVLDLMLPGLSGIEVCRRLRQSSSLPVIMLTAKDDVSDKVAGLDIGADDYMTKPFAIEELLARIRAALKRRGARADGPLRFGKLRIDSAAREAAYDGEPLGLTKKEFDLLEHMAKNENVALTRNQLLDQVWGYSFAGDTNVVDVYIRYLRSKLDQRFQVEYIHTLRGVGYLFRCRE